MIGVFSGTSDGKLIVENLLSRGFEVCCFNATTYGGTRYDKHMNLIVYDFAMDFEMIVSKVASHRISIIVDATHPYAENISSNLIEISDKLKLKYLRFERPLENMDYKTFDSYDEITSKLKNTEGNILLTIGSNNLEIFVNTLDKNRLYARVLPTENVIKKCYDLKLSPKNIIGIQGPFSKNMNKVMIEDFDIKYLVTKSSGKTGGFVEKVEASNEMNIEVLVLKRPDIKYPNLFNSITELLKEI